VKPKKKEKACSMALGEFPRKNHWCYCHTPIRGKRKEKIGGKGGYYKKFKKKTKRNQVEKKKLSARRRDAKKKLWEGGKKPQKKKKPNKWQAAGKR